MPDNKTNGMLERFLTYLIRDDCVETWKLAELSAANTKELGPPSLVAHTTKAEIYTWLA